MKQKRKASKNTNVYANDRSVENNFIEGRNSVIEALKSDKKIDKILVAEGNLKGSINTILDIAKEKGIDIDKVDKKEIDSISKTKSHQGVIAISAPYEYCKVEGILSYANQKNEDPFIVILDEIEDPNNFGSIIRNAEVFGVHGIIIPKRRNVGVTPAVYKSSSGAVEHMKIARVPNLNDIIDVLKEKGLWIYGADMEGEQYSYDTEFKGGVALVIGNEGKGISRLTKEKCDVIVKIPMKGKINSLNASVASGILMYEVIKQKV